MGRAHSRVSGVEFQACPITTVHCTYSTQHNQPWRSVVILSPRSQLRKTVKATQTCMFRTNKKSSYLYKIWTKCMAGNSLILSFAHFAQIKGATVSKSLRLLKTNERPERFTQKSLVKKVKSSFFSMFYIRFPLFWLAVWVNHSGRSPKMSDVSELLRLLTKNERPWGIRSGCSEEMSDVSE